MRACTKKAARGRLGAGDSWSKRACLYAVEPLKAYSNEDSVNEGEVKPLDDRPATASERVDESRV